MVLEQLLIVNGIEEWHLDDDPTNPNVYNKFCSFFVAAAYNDNGTIKSINPNALGEAGENFSNTINTPPSWVLPPDND